MKGALPIKGNHKFTVKATDPDGLSDSKDFYVAIALSDNPSMGAAGAGSEDPRFSVPQEFNYVEGAGDGTVVATFTVTDEDNGLGRHPFALDDDSVVITQLVVDLQSGGRQTPIPVTSMNQDADYVSAFRLSEPRKNGNTWTYDLIVKDTDDAKKDTTDILDHEVVDSVEVQVTATDGVGETDSVKIDVRIRNENEAPRRA